MKDYKKYFILQATPEEVYHALTNPMALGIWTNASVVMSTVPLTEFSLFDGDIEGMNLEFEENKKIVQEWYFGEQEATSIVTIKLHTQGEHTSVELRHTNIPDEAYDDMIEGWNEIYFGNLKEFFED